MKSKPSADINLIKDLSSSLQKLVEYIDDYENKIKRSSSDRSKVLFTDGLLAQIDVLKKKSKVLDQEIQKL